MTPRKYLKLINVYNMFMACIVYNVFNIAYFGKIHLFLGVVGLILEFLSEDN